MSAEQAVRLVQSGDIVSIGHAVGEPTALIDALVADAARLRCVELLHMVLMGSGAYLAAGMEDHFHHNSLFVGGAARKAVEQGRADFTPCYFHRVPELLRTTHRPDAAIIMVSPPDEEGNCSLGVSVDYTLAGALAAKTVIAQINRNMPRCHGDCFLHVTDFAAIVERDQPLIELPPPVIGEVERQIGRYCASLIRDGDCLQLGIGALPDAVLGCLGDKNDLGLHTEMFSDGAIDLIRAGNINGRRKNLHTGKHVATFLMGTKRLYDFVDDNPSICMAPVDYVNNPLVIGRNDNLVSINSCVQLDLSGQVCSESVGLRQISAVGGQVDFIRGAALSAGGRSIIAIASTAAGGKVSKIVPVLDEGAAVTTNRMDVEYIVTEFGIADLKGKSLRQRAEALIEVAHPDFRPMLSEAYERRFHQKWVG